MSTRVPVNPQLLTWAIDRSGLTRARLDAKFNKLDEWLGGERQPTLRQLESFATTTRTPIGFFFLPTSPAITLPIPDFRTMRDQAIEQPSPDLLDTIYACQQRQEWYRNYIRSIGGTPLSFVGSLDVVDDVVEAAEAIRTKLSFSVEQRQALRTWEEALRLFIGQVEDAGVLVMINGVVGSNSHRKLNTEEFRGFALVDDLAPLIFVNGADSKSARMFSLAHESAHVWLGRSALSDAWLHQVPSQKVEAWCNRVAAELLVPLDLLRQDLRAGEALDDALDRLRRRYKVSSLVILRRLYDARRLTRDQFWEAFNAELARLKAISRTNESSGGDFHRTSLIRNSRRFTRAVIQNTLEGQTTYKEAFRMLGFSKTRTFDTFAEQLGVR